MTPVTFLISAKPQVHTSSDLVVDRHFHYGANLSITGQRIFVEVPSFQGWADGQCGLLKERFERLRKLMQDRLMFPLLSLRLGTHWVVARYFEKALAGSQSRWTYNSADGAEGAVGLALRRCGVDESTSITVLTDGDAGLRAIHQQVVPHADHVLDQFHIAMRFSNLRQLAKGIDPFADGGKRSRALAEIDHAKWRFWNGLTERGTIGFVHLGQWACAECFDHISSLRRLPRMLSDTIRYLELNAGSMPDQGERYRAGQRISTGFVESAVNEIVAKRMVKKQHIPSLA